MKSIIFLATFLLVFSQLGIAQHFCAEHPATQLEIQKGALLNQKNHNSKGSKTSKSSEEVLEIPVVFHVIHHDSSSIGEEGNHTDSTIFATVDSVNNILAHTSGVTFDNPFSGVDIGVKLVIAKQDPDGNYTQGIIRYVDPVLSVVYEGASAGIMRDSTQKTYHWTVQDYLNVYLVHILDVDGVKRSGVAIYYFGDGTDIPDIDGIVLAKKGFDYPSIFAHELGHYLSLFHTFESWNCNNDNCEVNGDQVCDTPPKQSATDNDAIGCLANDDCNTDTDDSNSRNPFRPIDLGGLGNQSDGIENYMDNVLDCHCAFTQGQKDRIRTYIQSTRKAILSSHALIPLITSLNKSMEMDFSIYPTPAKGLLHISIDKNQILRNVKVYSIDGVLMLESDKIELPTQDLPKGVYIIHIETDKKVFSDTFIKY